VSNFWIMLSTRLENSLSSLNWFINSAGDISIKYLRKSSKAYALWLHICDFNIF
jgi:hypothetical protein